MGETGKRARYQKENNGSNKNQRRWVDKEERGGDELVAYRILCPDTVIGSVIGKAGKVINLIRQESRAKVKVVDPFPGAKDRVITIYCYVNEKVELDVDEEYNDKGPLCPAQDALLKMHAAISNALATLGDSERKQRDREECTILVPASQSANVIGKSGATIKKLRGKTRANVKVIPKDVSDPTHSCAMDFDNFVQIAGDSEAVKRALFAVSAIIYKFAAKEDIPLDTSVPEMAPSIIIPADLPIYPTSGFCSGADPIVPSRSAPSLIDTLAPEHSLSGYGDTGSMWPLVVPNYGGDSQSEELTIRVLCPPDIIGRVIGRGGSTIKSVRQASGAHIEVDDTKGTKDKHKQCVITITSAESLDDVQSKAVEAVLLLQEKINEDAENVTMLLLIPSRNIGCIIGKSGSIINEIRKRSRADIRISKGEKPKSADDEYVEVSGEVKNVRDALIQIVLRLRDDALNDKDKGNNPSAAAAAAAADHLYPGTSGLSMPLALQPPAPANRMVYEPRIESDTGVGMWSSSGFQKYGSMMMGDDAYGSSYSSKLYGGGVLPSSTLEMLIPANAAGRVIGKNGANIANIRQISGAVIEVSELRTSRGDRVAHISGTSEQKRSAENLIQAFIMAA
ncbi:hypothetical protein RND81_02G002100 [Saponaria officinalis]|uniref:K Homology domain-containing protein n=1 Tax=Saponaria officinalis TaxID=3572 RepID=A0AAW1MJM7_SAPOF